MTPEGNMLIVNFIIRFIEYFSLILIITASLVTLKSLMSDDKKYFFLSVFIFVIFYFLVLVKDLMEGYYGV
jgi:hypothetical protein